MAELESIKSALPADFVLQAKARAEAARLRHEQLAAEEPADAAPPTRDHNANVEAAWLALGRRFAVPEADAEALVAERTYTRPAQAPAPARAYGGAREREVHSGSFARQDDGLIADPTWLHFELSAIPSVAKAGFRTVRDRWGRGVWRAAVADVLRRHQRDWESVTGAIVVAARRVADTGLDARTRPTYCAAPGWGVHAYKVAGVEGLIHTGQRCRCGA